MADLTFDIGAKYREASSAFRELAGGVDDFQRKLKELDKAKANPKVNLVVKEAQQKLAKLKSELDNLRNVQLKIDADAAKARAGISGVERELERLRRQPTSVEVTAKTTIAEKRLKQLKAELATLKDARLNVTADVASANRDIAGLNSSIDRLQRPRSTTLSIGADTKTAYRDIDDFASQMKGRLTSAIDSLPPIRIGADISDADRKVNMFTVQTRERLLGLVKSLPDLTLNANLDSAMLEAQILALQARLASIGDFTVHGKADLDSVIGEIAALEAQLAAIGDKTVRVDVDTSRGVGSLNALTAASDNTGSALGRLASVSSGSISTRFGLMAATALPLLESLGQLSGALGLIPAVAMGAGTALATVAVGVQGLGTAFKSNTKLMELSSIITEGNVRALEGQRGAAKAVATATKAYDKELVKYQATLTGLAPSARDFVIQTLALGPAFSAVKLDVQQQLFEGFGRTLKELGATALPVIRGGLVQMASGMNEAALNVGKFATSKQAVADYTTIFDNIGSSARILAGAVQPVLQIFTDVALVGSEFLPGMATSFADAAQKAADFVSRARETGQLREWIQTGIDAVKLLWGALVDVIAIIKELATNSPFGPNFLEALKMVTGSIRWLIENVPGLTSAVNLFFAAWVFAKIAGGLAGMVTTIGTVAGALTGATGAVKGFGAASTAAGGASVAAAGKAKSAWVTAGLAIGAAYLAGQALKAAGEDLADPKVLADASNWDKFRDAMDTAGKLLTGDFKGFAEGIKTSWDASMIQMERRTNEYSTTTSGVISGLLTKIGLWFAEPKTLTLNADAADALAKGEAVSNAVLGIPQNWLTRFAGDPAGLNAAIAQATGGISAVQPEHWTGFFGDTGNILASAGTATSGINAVPGDHPTAFNGDPGGAVAAAGTAGDAINGVPDRVDTDINAQDNASSVIRDVWNALNGINGHVVTTFIDTVRRFFGDGGMILADGAVAMAPGGTLAAGRMQPMSSKTARIVPPNTQRVIGDRMTDDEAFIPINDSPWSTAILGETARRKGFALVPMDHGGVLPKGPIPGGMLPVPQDQSKMGPGRGNYFTEDTPGWLEYYHPGMVSGGSTSSTIGFSLTAMAHGGINSAEGMELYRLRKAAFEKHRREWARTHPGQEDTNTTVRQFWPEYADAVAAGFRGTVQQFYGQYRRPGGGGSSSGGRHNVRDERAWEWVAQLLQSLRGRPRGGGGFPGGGAIGGVGGPPGPAPTGRAMERTLTSRFQVAGGVASMTRANPLYSPMPYRPFAPDPRGGGGPIQIEFGRTGSRLFDEFLSEVAEKLRGRGGDSQVFFGRR